MAVRLGRAGLAGKARGGLTLTLLLRAAGDGSYVFVVNELVPGGEGAGREVPFVLGFHQLQPFITGNELLGTLPSLGGRGAGGLLIGVAPPSNPSV